MSLANIHQPSAKGFPCPTRTSVKCFNFWLIIPVRVQVQCSENKRSHVSSSVGKSQMNPLNYLHLSQPQVDIRGSKIAIYFLFDSEANSSSTLVFNFQDGRWRKVVEEPIIRLKEVLAESNKNSQKQDPIYIQGVLMTSVLRWWNNALNSLNDQIIAYVCELTNYCGRLLAENMFRKKTYSSKRCPMKPYLSSTHRQIALFTVWQPIFNGTTQS